MTPEQLREAAAVMLAAADRKKIQVREAAACMEWLACVGSPWNFWRYEYRIKPEPRKISVQLYEDQYGYVRAFTHPACVSKEWKPVSDIVEIEVKDE